LTVIFNLTNSCNLRCKHCYASYFARSVKGEMTTAQVKLVLKDLKKNGCLRVNFCGGEPLLRRDIGELINYAKLQGLSVDLTSNGILIPAKLNDIKNVKCLIISLDGRSSHHDFLRGKGSAKKALTAIESAKKVGIEVRANMVIHKYNLHDIDYMLKIAKRFNIKIHISLAIDNIFGNNKLLKIKPEDNEFRKILKYIIKKKKEGAPIMFSQSSYESVLKWPDFEIEGIIGGIKPAGMPTCPAGKIFGLIDADGKFWACPHLIGKVGAKNIFKDGVAKAWKKAGSHNCTACYQIYHHDFGMLMDLKVPVLWNYIKAAIK